MAGPVKIREGSTRKPVIYKAYNYVHLCMHGCHCAHRVVQEFGCSGIPGSLLQIL